MIRHSVIFKLNPSGKGEQDRFFKAVRELKQIAGVQGFECLQQVSPKNNFDFGISMEFDNQQGYDAYSNHAGHQLFIQNFWIPFVEDFLEIDYVVMGE